jgi:DNA primase small subunit
MQVLDGYQTLAKRYFYSLFPYEDIVEFLSVRKDTPLAHREFVFGYENSVYQRRITFADEKQFRDTVLESLPRRIDIGDPSSVPFCYHPYALASMKCRELVFDIDLDAYDKSSSGTPQLRFCCTGAKMCEVCWSFIVGGMQVLYHILANQFGFKKIFFFFSGRRGVHCWVCDEEIYKSADVLQQHRHILSYVQKEYYLRISDANNKVFSDPIVSRLRPVFEEMLVDRHKMLLNSDACEYILGFLDESTRTKIRKAWNFMADANSVNRWRRFEEIAPKSVVKFLILHYLYPRLDANVTTNMTHLIKCPFSPHPVTGKICVPLDPFEAQYMNFSAIPTLESLDEEINKQKVDINDADACLRQTSLYEYVDKFRAALKRK